MPAADYTKRDARDSSPLDATMHVWLTKDALEASGLITPAFVYDEAQLAADAALARAATRDAHTRLLFALKSFTVADGLRRIASAVDGFAASSLFEARLARQVLGATGSVHLTTPCLRSMELPALASYCDYISFNSLPQWERLAAALPARVSAGLRVNPQLSLVADPRYDPCRPHSKLGVPLEQLRALARADTDPLPGLQGLHVHSNCDCADFGALLRTVERLVTELDPLLRRVHWVNLGGGYLFAAATDLAPLHQAVALLQRRYGVEVFVEPGAAIARRAGYLIGSVVDIFAAEGERVAVLDTTVNHLPEVFEYQFEPDVLGYLEDGPHSYRLAGASCLAGDEFGVYSFAAPLAVGDPVVFTDVGAYSLVKANLFNGINLPNIYARTAAGELTLKRRFDYAHFLAHCGVADDACI